MEKYEKEKEVSANTRRLYHDIRQQYNGLKDEVDSLQHDQSDGHQ
jgi:hypothetical protein